MSITIIICVNESYSYVALTDIWSAKGLWLSIGIIIETSRDSWKSKVMIRIKIIDWSVGSFLNFSFLPKVRKTLGMLSFYATATVFKSEQNSPIIPLKSGTQ